MHVDRVHTCPLTSAQQETQSEGLASWLAREGGGEREGKTNGRGDGERGGEGKEGRRGEREEEMMDGVERGEKERGRDNL